MSDENLYLAIIKGVTKKLCDTLFVLKAVKYPRGVHFIVNIPITTFLPEPQ